MSPPKPTLPTDVAARKATPLQTGCYDYFPAALAYIARISRASNEQHNPGEPMHWSRGKSNDHADAAARHATDRGTIDTDGFRHTGKAAWRWLAELQEELEREEGAPLPRGARADTPAPATGTERRTCGTCAHDTKTSGEPPCRECRPPDDNPTGWEPKPACPAVQCARRATDPDCVSCAPPAPTGAPNALPAPAHPLAGGPCKGCVEETTHVRVWPCSVCSRRDPDSSTDHYTRTPEDL